MEETEEYFKNVKVSLQAMSKARYFSTGELVRRVKELDGTLFREADTGDYLLKTERNTSHRGKVCIRFKDKGDTAVVITQTSDHYDWSKMKHNNLNLRQQ